MKQTKTMTQALIKSNDFLSTYEWRKLRQEVITKNDGRCECCGAKAEGDVYLCVDHILPRKTHPELALEITNLQVLCNICNHGKGNWDTTDWREEDSSKFKITKEWLEANRTKSGGYTSRQIKLLGTGTSGWQKRAIGSLISVERKLMFEEAKNHYSANDAKIKEIMQKKETAAINVMMTNEYKKEMATMKLEIKRLNKSLNDLKRVVYLLKGGKDVKITTL